MAGTIHDVANVWMPVEDVERAARFYGEVLGLSQIKRDGDWVEFDANGVHIGLNGRERRGAGGNGGPVVTFETEASMEATVEDLQRQGVEFPTGITEHPWGRVVTFKDTEGNDLQLYEPPKG